MTEDNAKRPMTGGEALAVASEIDINAPLNEVAAFSANPDNVPNWRVNIHSVEWKTPPPLQVGSRIAFVARFLDQQLVYTYEIADYSHWKRLVMRTSEGPFLMETRYEWESISQDCTRMTLRHQGNPEGFSRVVAPFIASGLRQANQTDLALLKRIIEQRGGHPLLGR